MRLIKPYLFGFGLLTLLLVGVGLMFAPTQAASGEKFDLLVYPSVWTVTNSSSNFNLIAVRGKNGFTGDVSVTVSGLPSSLIDHYPTSQEFSEGKGGYYCTDHCQAAPNADFPMGVHIDDGGWTSVGPTLLFGSSTTTETKTVTITATGGGTSVSQSFMLKVIDDSFTGFPPTQANAANPDAIVTINNAEFGVNAYKINLTAGQSRSVNVDVKNNETSGVSLQLLSVLTGGGVADVTSSITGGFSSSSITLAAGERRTLPFTITTQSTSINGTYEFILGVAQTDGSNRATLGISTILSGGASGAVPTTSAPSTINAPTTTAATLQPSLLTSASTTASPAMSVSSESPSSSPGEVTTRTTANEPGKTSSQVGPEVEQTVLWLDQPLVLAQTVSQEILVPVAVTGAIVAATNFATTVVPISAFSTGVGITATLSTYLLLIWNALLEGVGLRRRRYPWGTVFDVQSDLPLELAIVRLKTAEGRILETRVTDRAGRFGFLAHPGTFLLETIKNGFETAPASSASGSRYQPVLPSPKMVIAKNEAVIRANIPLRSLAAKGRSWLPGARWLGILHRPAIFMSVPVGLVNYLLLSSSLNLIVLLVLGVVIASEWLILTPRFFGLVTGPDFRPLAGVVLQLVRTEDMKVVGTQVTDYLGRYSFLVRPGSYQMRVNSLDWRAPRWLDKTVFTVTKATGGIIDRWIPVLPAISQGQI